MNYFNNSDQDNARHLEKYLITIKNPAITYNLVKLLEKSQLSRKINSQRL